MLFPLSFERENFGFQNREKNFEKIYYQVQDKILQLKQNFFIQNYI